MGSRRFAVTTIIFSCLAVVSIALPVTAAPVPQTAAQRSLRYQSYSHYAGHVAQGDHAGHVHSWLGADGHAVPFDSDEEILDFLRTADVVSMETITTGVTKPKKLLLERDGMRVHAVFRSIDVTKNKVRLDNGHFYMRLRDYGLFEVAAYRLARMLGYDNVPPAVVRRIGTMHGSLQLWVEQAMVERGRREAGVQPPNFTTWLQQMQDMHLFDYLITNIDRHTGNYLMGHTGKLWMIDHTRAFQMHVGDWTPDKIWFVKRQLWQRLQALDRETLQATLGDVLTEFEVEELMARIDTFKVHIRGHIARRGAAEVISAYRSAVRRPQIAGTAVGGSYKSAALSARSASSNASLASTSFLSSFRLIGLPRNAAPCPMTDCTIGPSANPDTTITGVSSPASRIRVRTSRPLSLGM